MFATDAAFLLQERIEIRRFSLATAPVLHSFMEDWETIVVKASFLISRLAIVRRFAG